MCPQHLQRELSTVTEEMEAEAEAAGATQTHSQQQQESQRAPPPAADPAAPAEPLLEPLGSAQEPAQLTQAAAAAAAAAAEEEEGVGGTQLADTEMQVDTGPMQPDTEMEAEEVK